MTPVESGDPRPVFRLGRAHAGMGLFLGGIVGLLGAFVSTWLGPSGAAWGTATDATVTGATKSNHWAFQPIKRPAVPTFTRPPSTIHNPIDAFVLARLQKEGLSPSPEADRATLGSVDRTIDRFQKLLAAKVTVGTSLVDELIAERAEMAGRE